MPGRAAKIAVCGTLTSLTTVDVPQTTIMTKTHTINGTGWATGGTNRLLIATSQHIRQP
jgi:hypothetical protein